VQVRRRVRQIDCVTVKGSNRPMGLFTYDVSLERVPSPDQAAPWGGPAAAAAGFSRRESMASSVSATAAAPPEIEGDPVSFSLSAYNWEFSDHPDLAHTWAVDHAFLDLFARVRNFLCHPLPCVSLPLCFVSFLLFVIFVVRMNHH
jgi:hypothetical protein